MTCYLFSVQLISLEGLLFFEGKQEVDCVQGKGNEGKKVGKKRKQGNQERRKANEQQSKDNPSFLRIFFKNHESIIMPL